MSADSTNNRTIAVKSIISGIEKRLKEAHKEIEVLRGFIRNKEVWCEVEVERGQIRTGMVTGAMSENGNMRLIVKFISQTDDSFLWNEKGWTRRYWPADRLLNLRTIEVDKDFNVTVETTKGPRTINVKGWW